MRYAPVLYVTSEEGGLEVETEDISWNAAAKWEEANFPSAVIGFWAARLHPKKGVMPTVEDMKGLKMQHDLIEDETGKRTGPGTLKFNSHP